MVSNNSVPVDSTDMPAKWRQYHTTKTSCDCPDFRYRQGRIAGGRCKHMAALIAAGPEVQAAHVRQTVDEINACLFG